MFLKRFSIPLLLTLLLAPFWSRCQGVKAGSIVPEIAVAGWLNAGAKREPLAEDRLTLLDFFGTWCTPCLRALPHLSELQQQFSGKMNVVLVSNEPTAQLNRFLAARPSFAFPVLVDSGDRWNNHFRPPSLPFTVVLRGHRVLAVSDAASITATQIRGWLSDSSAALDVTPASKPGSEEKGSNMQYSNNATVRLSQQYLYAARTGSGLEQLQQQLEVLSPEQLSSSLQSDAEKNAFWINVYNGYTQAALKAAPDKYRSRNAFFKEKSIRIAGSRLSLDQIEHGFLRHSRIKWSLGYLGKPFPSKTEKMLRVRHRDYRIHFALNCGAKSCPPIAFYNDGELDRQLETATKAFLTGESEYDSAANTVSVPKILSWFRADFGGKKGIRTLLEKHGIIPAGSDPKIRFKEYDWTLTLNNYKP